MEIETESKSERGRDREMEGGREKATDVCPHHETPMALKALQRLHGNASLYQKLRVLLDQAFQPPPLQRETSLLTAYWSEST